MAKQANRDRPTTVRLTDAQRSATEARAAAEGRSLSKYIEGILADEVQRPRPTLASAGALLAVCRALIDVSDHRGIDTDTRLFVRRQVKLVFEILRQHGHQGYLK